MIRGLFRLIYQLVILAILLVVGTAVWIVFDGLNDKGDRADCAVVLGHAVKHDGQPGPILRARLDRAVELYRDHKVPYVIVSGADHVDNPSEATGMAAYLMAHQVPRSVIIEDHGGLNTRGTAHDVAAMMRQRGFRSVTIVSHYYHITRTKLALKYEGVAEVSQAHVGVVRKEDAFNVARETVAIYYYLYNYYLRQAVNQAVVVAKTETAVVTQKISSAAEKASSSAPSAPATDNP